jgi:hypothetical protein
MPRTGVQYEEVASAASLLRSEGLNVTIEQVRQKLGTGSSNTLSKHLSQWRTSNTPSAYEASLPAALSQQVAAIWNQLSASAEERIHTTIMLTHLLISHFSNENSKLRENNRRWQKLHEMWLGEKKSQEDKNSQLSASNAELNTKLQIQQQHIIGLERLLVEKDNNLQRLETLFNQAQTNLEHFREASREQLAIEENKLIQNKQTNDEQFKTVMGAIGNAFNQDKYLTLIEQIHENQINALKDTNEMLYAIKCDNLNLEAQVKATLIKTLAKVNKGKFLL